MKYCLHRDKLMSATANPTILISKILYCHACRTDLERRAGRISAKRSRRSRVRRLRTKQKQGAPTRTPPEKSTYDSDMYNRAFPVGNALFFFAWDMMSLLRLPRGKLPLTFLAVPAGKNGWVECPCQTVNDFIGVGGSVCGLFLFVQTQAPLTVPPWQSRARKSKFKFLSSARARMLSALHLRLGARWWLTSACRYAVLEDSPLDSARTSSSVFKNSRWGFKAKRRTLTCSGCVRSFGFKSNVISQLFRIRNMSAYAELP